MALGDLSSGLAGRVAPSRASRRFSVTSELPGAPVSSGGLESLGRTPVSATQTTGSSMGPGEPVPADLAGPPVPAMGPSGDPGPVGTTGTTWSGGGTGQLGSMGDAPVASMGEPTRPAAPDAPGGSNPRPTVGHDQRTLETMLARGEAPGFTPGADVYKTWNEFQNTEEGRRTRAAYEAVYNSKTPAEQQAWRDYAAAHSAAPAAPAPEHPATPWGTWEQTPTWAQEAHNAGTNVLPFQSGDAGPRIDTGAKPEGMSNEEYAIWKDQPYQSYSDYDALLDPSGQTHPASLGDQPRQAWRWA